MREFRKKQKLLNKIMISMIIITLVFILVYIFFYPTIAQNSDLGVKICTHISDILIVASLVLTLIYYSRYGKSDSFLNYIEHEISDNGYYITSREENSIESYVEAIYEDLKNANYSMSKNIEIYDFDFDVRGMKKRQLFYVAGIENLDKNDVLSYLESVINDVTVSNLKRKCDVVLSFVTDKACDDAIALSKMITPLGKKEQIKIALSIVEIDTKNVYFLGNMQTKCHSMIANHIMNCEIPIKDKYICSEKLKFQYELEEHMKTFNLKDFNNGSFYAH